MPTITKNQARDIIRRDKLKKLTSQMEYEFFGTGTNTVGDAASHTPSPTNEEINSQLDMALSYLNRKCHLGFTSDKTIAVTAQTANGAYGISLRSIGDITDVHRVFWEDGSNNTRRLLPKSRQSFDTGYAYEWQQYQPVSLDGFIYGYFWIEGETLFMLPSPSTAGTLHLLVGTGIAFVGDLAVLDVLPDDYHDIVWTTAAALVAENSPSDAELAMRAAILRRQSDDGIRDILEHKRDVSTEEPEAVTVRPSRLQPYRSTRRHLGVPYDDYGIR